jgi:hypothetical protein
MATPGLPHELETAWQAADGAIHAALVDAALPAMWTLPNGMTLTLTQRDDRTVLASLTANVRGRTETLAQSIATAVLMAWETPARQLQALLSHQLVQRQGRAAPTRDERARQT